MFSPHRHADPVIESDSDPLRIGTTSPTPAAFRSQVGPLLPVSLMTILDAARPWLLDRVHLGLAMVPGTADAWAALDFSGWLNRSLGSAPGRTWDIERDTAIYDDREQLVSLVFNRRTTTPVHPILAVGFRVQSLLVSTARFIQDVEAELARLERQPRRAEFQAAERHLLVVTMDGAGLAAGLSVGLESRAVRNDGAAMLWKGYRR